MRLSKAIVAFAPLLMVGACAVIPDDTGYDTNYYGYGYSSPPAYYPGPTVVTPSVGFGYYDQGREHWEHERAEHREHERDEHREHEHDD